MSKRIIFYLAILGLFFACEEDKIAMQPDANTDGSTKSVFSPAMENAGVQKGVMRIKLSKKIGDDISIMAKNSIVQCSATPLNTLLSNIKATSMRRLYPYAGKFEERTRREGLHLWYVVNFDENVLVANAYAEAKKVKGIEMVEEVYQLKMPEVKVKEAPANAPMDNKKPFNDPGLKYQWHYKNFGTFSGSVKGADINLFKAWEIETGKPNVIVCVVDGGIDYKHVDLKDNMHINEAELNGEEGKDDDNNGYIDDIYGFNFVFNNGDVVPDKYGHGTHVSGTVAARNNNGKGVCGVAGGDGTPDSGIRMISAQIFAGNGGGDSGAAIKYGADNGAVISQNSWGYPYPGPGYLPASDKAGIDYFIKYAGCDNKGNQLADSPMKGGIVIFAAGNDNKDFLSYPAAYDKVVAVTAMGPDMKRAYYSTYGTWADIMATGGSDAFSRGEVFSTMPNNRYGYMQGTSMACPHVSGIAALIVSKFGGQGFTPEKLRQRLLGGLRPFNIDKENPKYKGKLGVGYIDAYGTLAENKNKKPGNPTFESATPDFVSIDFSWKAVADEDDGTPSIYKLYYSKEKLTEANYKNADFEEVTGGGYEVGETINYTLKKLPLNTQFYFALEAVDRWGLTSEKAAFTQAKTKENHAPTAERAGDEVIRLEYKKKMQIKLNVNEPDGQVWSYKLEGDKKGVSSKRDGDKGIILKFTGTKPFGKYTLKVIVKDIFDATAEVEIPFEYFENKPPVISKEFEKMFAPVKKALKIDLSQHFTDPEGKALTFETTSSSNFKVNVEGNTLSVTPSKLGKGTISITAKDPEGKSVTAELSLQAVNDGLVYLMYPVPVTTTLNIQLSNEVKTATLKIFTLTGKEVMKKKTSTRKVTWNLSKLSGGTYVLQAEANGKTFKQSFVKY